MAGKWPYKRIDEIALKVAMGPFGSSIKVETFTDSGIPIISGQHLRKAELTDGEFNFITEEHANSLKNANVQRGDVIFTHAGNIGQVSFIPDDSKYQRYVISQRQFYLRCDIRLILPEFITYFFKSPKGQHKLLANANQVGVPSIARPSSYLKTIEVPVPSLEEQRIIVRNIKALDAKVRANLRINQTLEAMAQAIFKSWFVDFDPVKAKIAAIAQGQDPLRAAMRAISGKTDTELDQMPREHHAQLAATAALFPDAMDDSELGEIPKGWGSETIGSYFDLTMGQSPPGNTYNETGEGMPFYQGRTDFGVRFPTERVYCTAPTRLAKKGNVLVSVRAPVGDINVAVSDCAIGRGVAAVRYEHSSFALYVLRHQEPVFKRFESEGTVFGSINKKQFESLPLVVAPDKLVRHFQSLVGSLDKKIESNEWQIRNLAALRDTLLPKLLSGELSVTAMEIPE